MPSRLAQGIPLALLALAGCVADGPAPASIIGAGAGAETLGAAPAGESWASVLPGPAIVGLRGDGPAPGWIETRGNGALAPERIEPLLAINDWPRPARPSLDRPRLVRIVRGPEGFIYYRAERRTDHYHVYRRGW